LISVAEESYTEIKCHRNNLGYLRRGWVIGVDVDKSASTNPYIDEFHVIAGPQTGLDDDSIDVCICDNVIEHIDIVESFFFEVRRIIKDQGYLCIRTPNLWNYIAIFSKIVPNKFHSSIITKIQNGRKKEDIFPVYYRCNTISKLNSLLDYYGFKDRVVYGYEAEPSYLSFSRIAYFFGYLHQKFAPNFLKCTIFAFAQLKKS
jgi:SAM-dependent methyltransferase